ncbi:MAG TPA: hypothetical protein VKB52_11175 [Rhodanobacteraceae bacterium]|nr:hypothetical protein [Rhodanobacteraceae bacterium]
MTDRVLFAEPKYATLLRRMHLIDHWDRSAFNRRMLLALAVAWAPLFVINLLRYAVWHDAASLTFFTDIAVNAHLLLAVPLMIAAEYLVLRRLERLAGYFRDSLVESDELARFDAIVASARERSAGAWPSLIVAALSYASVAVFFVSTSRERLLPWRVAGPDAFSTAGWWHLLVSLPLLGGLIFAWLWRLGIWTRCLQALSRLHLRLIAVHPDGAAGLRFVANSPVLFAPVALAFGIVVAGAMANDVMHSGLQPLEHGLLPIVTALLAVVLFASPPLVFSGALLDAWRRGQFLYGDLARRMGGAFERKWFASAQPVDESTLSAPDFSSTTDLYGIVSNLNSMQLVLIDYRAVIAIAVAALLPFAPIWLTAVPFDTVLDAIKGVLL